MPWPVHPNGLLGAQGDNDTYRIERSLRFNSADSAFLNRTFSSGNRRLWTWSGWIKRTKLGTIQRFFTCRTASNDNDNGEIGFADDAIQVSGWGTVWRKSSALLRDPSSWYHFVVTIDTANATANNRIRVYLNGSELTSFSTLNNPGLSADLGINQAAAHRLGVADYGDYADFYLTEVNFIDGQALTPSSFGETDAITGRWKAKAYSGTYGTNGFYLKFADNSGTTSTTLGKDSSPNGNNWTPNNFVVSPVTSADNDSLVDSPTNYGSDTGVGGEVRGNYCTLNPLSNNGGTMLDGNLDFYGPSDWRFAGGTIAVSSGKWYIEATHFGASPGNNENNVYTFFGFIKPSTSIAAGNSQLSYTSSVIGISDSGWAYNFASGSSATTGFGSGDVASIAIDFTTGSYNIRKNNTSVASGTMAFTGELIPCIFSYESTYRWQPNFGQRPFAYTAPTGFKALCTTNLSTPTIKKPSSYFDVVTRTSDGASNYTKTGLGFSPDLIWTKDRTSAYDHVLWDTTRGTSKYLNSNTTSTEQTAGQLTSFNADGYTVGYGMGQANFSTDRYVDWIWEEATISGLDIVGFTAPASGSTTISHNLGVAPKLIIAKSRNTAVNWTVYHASVTSKDQYLLLNGTNALATSTDIWGTSAPTSSVFGFNVNNQGASASVVAYLFAEVEGFSKFGSYTGNASTDGPFVWCGFRPKLIIGKRTDAVENWIIYDTSRDSFNVASAQLQPNTSIAETTANALIDFNSNGFKFRSTNSFNGNSAGGTHIFAAFAESPFKYARAR